MLGTDTLSQDLRGLGPPLGLNAEGKRLDQFLAQEFPFKSRDAWKAACRDGELFVNGVRARATRKLRAGDRLAVFHPLASEPAVDDRIAFLKEDDGLLALFKPANLPMHESGFYRRNTFVAILQKRFGAQWAPVHRLDRETSGVVLCAASPELRRSLSLDFETRAVQKNYLAILEGGVSWSTLTVDQPLALTQHDDLPVVVTAEDGQASVTEFKVIAKSAKASLVACTPRTGRTNQIRVHAASIGHHIIGDKVYHPDASVRAAYRRLGDVSSVQAMAGFARHALHAADITVRHPFSGESFHASAALPEDLELLWRQLS